MTACPCGRDAAYDACCAPFHRGAEPPDATQLMRARYAAFVRGEIAFLHRTLHPDHPDAALGEADFARRLRAHLARARYQSLEVLDAAGPDADGVAWVLFRVRARVAGRDASFAELSSFAAHAGGLRYVAGRAFPFASCPRSVDDARAAR